MSLSVGAGILLVSHGDLSKHFLDAARIIYQQDLDYVFTIGIKASQNRDKVTDRLCEIMGEIAKKHKKVLVLCDTHGATASRLVCENTYDRLEFQCVYGLNLPMLLEAVNYRDEYELDELAEQVSKIGKEAIFVKQPGEDE